MTHSFNTIHHPLIFKKPSGTSRGILTKKDSWFVFNKQYDRLHGIGEVSTISRLSIDIPEEIPSEIGLAVDAKGEYSNPLFPAVQFGAEILEKSSASSNPFLLYDNPFSRGESGIAINGLIWMGSRREMKEQIDQKLKDGFRCLKLKIGAIDFEEEMSLLHYVRSEYSPDELELRVDANGAFGRDALERLKRLSNYQIHSIEQPIQQGQWEYMSNLCEVTPVDIALDEELIGVSDISEKVKLLEQVKPQYIILKPSLIGGFHHSEEWIALAKERNIGWWVTSALESNIGLNAIAQWVSSLSIVMPQGLGTGGLYVNNIPSPLTIKDAALWYRPDFDWDLSLLDLN